MPGKWSPRRKGVTPGAIFFRLLERTLAGRSRTRRRSLAASGPDSDPIPDPSGTEPAVKPHAALPGAGEAAPRAPAFRRPVRKRARSIRRVPPTRSRQTARPRPLPPLARRVVKKGSKACAAIAASMPQPRSLTSMHSWPDSSTAIRLTTSVAELACKALSTRFASTRTSSSPPAHSRGRPGASLTATREKASPRATRRSARSTSAAIASLRFAARRRLVRCEQSAQAGAHLARERRDRARVTLHALWIRRSLGQTSREPLDHSEGLGEIVEQAQLGQVPLSHAAARHGEHGPRPERDLGSRPCFCAR